jgi:hypothetical protein
MYLRNSSGRASFSLMRSKHVLENGSIPILSLDSVYPLQMPKLNLGIRRASFLVDTKLREDAGHRWGLEDIRLGVDLTVAP